MNTNQDYISYKKVLLFGTESTGKSSLIYRLEKGKFPDSISPTEESK
jgi:GTPase SAR1 family protein